MVEVVCARDMEKGAAVWVGARPKRSARALMCGSTWAWILWLGMVLSWIVAALRAGAWWTLLSTPPPLRFTRTPPPHEAYLQRSSCLHARMPQHNPSEHLPRPRFAPDRRWHLDQMLAVMQQVGQPAELEGTSANASSTRRGGHLGQHRAHACYR